MAKIVTAFIGLGGNIGDVFANMQSALRSLDSHTQISVISISSVYKTPPWGIEDQDWFLNACACVETSLTGHELLVECLSAEKSLNRVRETRWGPRTIDLDVLIYNDEKIDTAELQVPHPRMQERGFVLLPLTDIAPNLIIKEKSVLQWVKTLDISDIQKTELSLTV